MRHARRTVAGGVLIAALVGVLAACGGDEKSSSAAEPPSAAEPRKADFTLAKQSDVGLRQAYATFTSRSDGKTSAIIDLTVERTEDASGDVYAVSVREGSCAALGKISVEVGDATNGITTFLLDESFDDVVSPIKEGNSSIVIMKDGGNGVAWCGATLTG